MKVLQFPVPVASECSIVVKQDIHSHFYNYLHSHAEVQITLIVKGDVTLIAGNYTQHCTSGDIFFIGANQPHIFRSNIVEPVDNTGNNVNAIHVFIDYRKGLAGLMDLPEILPIKKFLDSTVNGLQVPAEHVPLMSELIHQVRDSDGLNRLLLLVKLLQFCERRSNEWKSLSTGVSNYSIADFEGARMNDVYQYIMDHYAENIPLEKIASIACITPHAFCKYFKRHTCKTYLNFLNEVRINQACKTIISKDFTSMTHVAYTNGFNSVNTFNRVFKKITGLAPKDYIRKNKVAAYAHLSGG